VNYVLDTNDVPGYSALAQAINNNDNIKLVLIQHEFGFFQPDVEEVFLHFLKSVDKPVIIVFHTVLPNPDPELQLKVANIAGACQSVVVMTKNAAQILTDDYKVPQQKVVVIAHGTHLVPHLNKEFLKAKHGLKGRKVLSTFGLLSSGKGIETTLRALPAIIALNPDVTFLVIGKTHPGVVKSEGEKYRESLESLVESLQLGDYVYFINRYLPLNDLLEYLQMTDIYLFTSKDPNQAVSGTFSYAMSCGCPIISTPIPHAREVLRTNTGIVIDFQNSDQLAAGVNRLMSDEALRMAFSASTLQRIVPTAWENSAIAHAMLVQKIARQPNGTAMHVQKVHTSIPNEKMVLQYSLPDISLEHMLKMTTDFGMYQFSIINQPDPESGYTLDDNARALVAISMHYDLTGDKKDLTAITTYLNFIRFCQQPEGDFLNYVDVDRQFTDQNETVNLADANGRAIWALGFFISKRRIMPPELIETAEAVLALTLPLITKIHSTRAMAFVIKGLYHSTPSHHSNETSMLIKILADRLLQMYRHESEPGWEWFEHYMTYGNSILPEAMLCAWLATGNPAYKITAITSFDFLLSRTFNKHGIKVISNQGWLHKGKESAPYGEQPIDVAYTVMALNQFFRAFKDENYAHQMATAFNWFLGNNHLHQIIYNPCTGGCYDGLEEEHVNLNQGAESTISYLLARLTMDRYAGMSEKGQ